jgi:hypothetical protein
MRVIGSGQPAPAGSGNNSPAAMFLQKAALAKIKKKRAWGDLNPRHPG